MHVDRSQSWNERGGPTASGMYWRAKQTSEVLAATIYMPEFEGPQHAHAEAQVAILLSGSSVTINRNGTETDFVLSENFSSTIVYSSNPAGISGNMAMISDDAAVIQQRLLVNIAGNRRSTRGFAG